MYGPPVKPPQPTLGLSAAFGGGDRLADQRRRGPVPPRPLHDVAAVEPVSVDGHVRRAQPRGLHASAAIRTNTPLQALVTLNDPVYVEAAQALARRIVAEGGTTPSERVAFALPRSAWPGRRATPKSTRLVKLYEQALAEFRDRRRRGQEDGDRAARRRCPRARTSAELAAWTVVGNVLLNLDEMLMKR